MLKQGPDSTWHVSLRSLGSVDVRNIAERQGGGGHRFAAGFTSDESAEAYERALALVTNPVERAFLDRRRAQVAR